jgi:hypothetical protein
MSRQNLANPDHYKTAGRERPNKLAEVRIQKNRAEANKYQESKVHKRGAKKGK